MSRYHAPAPVYDFVLLFLPPRGPHLTPLATGSLESGLLVSPLLGGPSRHRPFVPTLHLHQWKSSHNLHLQYSAKSQSTPRCQSLITARSDHPPVLGRSSPHHHLRKILEIHRKFRKMQSDFVGLSECRSTISTKHDHSFDLYILNENSNLV
jgi:hypothetical protein